MSQSWKEYFGNQLERMAQQQVMRLRGGQMKPSDVVESNQLDFGSNDYLGFRRHPSVLESLRNAIELYGWGSGASPVLSGYTAEHKRLENQLASLSGTEDSLVFSSGFACNSGVLSCLLDEQTLVLSDRLNHASLIDGIRRARSRRYIYNHCDMHDLRVKLEYHRRDFARCLIVTESVFSMDGDEAPLQELVELSVQFDCGLVVDEAHAVGIFGGRGGGLIEEQHLSASVLVKLGTLSKALGGIGGYVAGSKPVIETLVNCCRSYLFSTAPPAASMKASQTAVDLLRDSTRQREHLLELGVYARQRLTESGWRVVSGRSPIVPIIIGKPKRTIELSKALRELGILVPAIRPPTVPPDTCRLRVSLSASHSMQDIERLCAALKNWS